VVLRGRINDIRGCELWQAEQPKARFFSGGVPEKVGFNILIWLPIMGVHVSRRVFDGGGHAECGELHEKINTVLLFLKAIIDIGVTKPFAIVQAILRPAQVCAGRVRYD
jgi:hypothetical protein